MVMAVIGGLAWAKISRVVQIFSSSWMVLWDDWEIRVVILYSLLIQIVLMVMGSRRKYMSQIWARVIIWAAYLSADWAATFALGLLSDRGGDHTDGSADPGSVMTAFWAPFFLLHLGGPDTITAYSLEDNELWLRHFLSVFSAFMIALYVFLKFWKGTLLDYAGIPIFVAGFTKCVERTLALIFASESYFSESLIYSPKIQESLVNQSLIKPNERETETMPDSNTNRASAGEALQNRIPLGKREDSDYVILHYAYEQFMIFMRLFADLTISEEELKSSKDYLRANSSDKAFKLIDIELGLLYDLRYTKAKLTFSRIGCLLRFLSLSSSMVTLVVFVIVDKHQYSEVHLTITWLLLVGAISLEFYAITILVSSDWFMIWLVDPSSQGISRKLRDQLKKPVSMIVRFLQLLHIVPGKKRWSGTLGQYNLISFCCYKMPAKCTKILKFFGIYALLEKERPKHLVKVPKELNEWIFDRLQRKMDHGMMPVHSFRDLMLADVAKEFDCLEFFISCRLSFTFENIEIDESILIWHIATDLCYNEDLESQAIVSEGEVGILKGSKWLSDYMLYLLVTKPSMLPKGIGQLHFRHTCLDVKRLIEKGCSLNKARSLLYNKRLLWTKELSSSVLSNAADLAERLQYLVAEKGWDTERKWRLISYIWIEIICCAAAQCSSNEHAQQLRRGGELLTHVWFLMAHMGFTRSKNSFSLKKT